MFSPPREMLVLTAFGGHTMWATSYPVSDGASCTAGVDRALADDSGTDADDGW